jgi:small-conductance mechanosensitive channel
MITAFRTGINLELMAWIEDPERGKLSPQSDPNLVFVKACSDIGVEIPFPRRDIRIIEAAQCRQEEGS